MTPPLPRQPGLDLARALALCGMVLVSFHLASASSDLSGWLDRLIAMFQGRPAALFVTLAGLGIGLGSKGMRWRQAAARTARRGLFLLILGLANTLLFPADILHFYGAFFLIAALCLRLPSSLLLMVVMGLADLFVTLLFVFDYPAGWRWQDLSYPGFWQPLGFARNLLFNGWYPVVPWLAFLLLGLWLSRFDLASPRVRGLLLTGGVAAAVLAKAGSLLLSALFPAWDSLFALEPMPPLPLFLLSAAGIACALIALCLLLGESVALRALLPMGRQTLTLYLLHLPFVSLLTELDATAWQSLLAASLWLWLAARAAEWWQRHHGRGPLEALMRRLCDRRMPQ